MRRYCSIQRALLLFRALVPGIIHDGLWDVYNDHHMGICAEKCSEAHGIGREAQDKHATESYERAALAWEKVRAEQLLGCKKNQVAVLLP